MERRVLLCCGILSSLLYVAMNIFIPMRFEGYNAASQTVSELSAIGAPTRTLWVSLGTLYTFLITLFGFGVWQSAGRSRLVLVLGGLIFAYGIVNFFWPFAPMHQRETLASRGESYTDKMHIGLAMVTVLLMGLSIGFGAAAFGKRFRLYSILTMLILLVFGVLTTAEAPRISANLPTPRAGVWERINIGVFLLWIIVLAILLLRSVTDNKTIKNNALA